MGVRTTLHETVLGTVEVRTTLHDTVLGGSGGLCRGNWGFVYNICHSCLKHLGLVFGHLDSCKNTWHLCKDTWGSCGDTWDSCERYLGLFVLRHLAQYLVLEYMKLVYGYWEFVIQ